jgi:hypothetical protein
MAGCCEDGNEPSVCVTGEAEKLSASKEGLFHMELISYINYIITSKDFASCVTHPH